MVDAMAKFILMLSKEQARRKVRQMLVEIMDPAVHREDIDPRKSLMDILQPDQVALVFHGLVPRRGYHFPVRKGDDPDIVVDLALMAGQGIDIEFPLRVVDIEIPDLTVEPDMMDLIVIFENLVSRIDRDIPLVAEIPDVPVEMIPMVVGIEQDVDLVHDTPHDLIRNQSPVTAVQVYGDNHIMNSFDFNNDEVYRDFLDSVLNPHSIDSNVREGATLDISDRIVILSTCLNYGDGRYLVVGKLTGESPLA